MKGGRQTTFTEEIAETICAGIAEGRSLRSICVQPDMPGLRTVFDWLNHDEVFRAKYAHAREVQAEVFADAIIEISDEVIPCTEHGLDAGAVAQQRMRIDARKWMACKLKPKKFGDKIEQEIKHDVTDTLSDLLVTIRGGKPE